MCGILSRLNKKERTEIITKRRWRMNWIQCPKRKHVGVAKAYARESKRSDGLLIVSHSKYLSAVRCNNKSNSASCKQWNVTVFSLCVHAFCWWLFANEFLNLSVFRPFITIRTFPIRYRFFLPTSFCNQSKQHHTVWINSFFFVRCDLIDFDSHWNWIFASFFLP